MSEMISREAAAAICDEAACETDSESARYEMFRARDAIRALPAVQPRVKPLVWDDNGSADVYRVTFANGQGPKAFLVSRGAKIIGWHDDPDLAKAAAQADYEARILAAMYPAVQPDAAAIRKAALRDVLEACAAEVDQMRKIWRGANNANKMRRELEADGAFELLAVLAGMISIGKEVMPDAASSARGSSDIGPGDQAVAGAAKFALDRIREWESDNLTDGTERDWHGHVGPALARLASTLVAQPEQVAGAAQPDKINWRDDPDAIVEDDEPQIGRDYA